MSDADCCSCHISPPCSYCTSRCECSKCGKIVGEDEVNDDSVCEQCLEEEVE